MGTLHGMDNLEFTLASNVCSIVAQGANSMQSIILERIFDRHSCGVRHTKTFGEAT